MKKLMLGLLGAGMVACQPPATTATTAAATAPAEVPAAPVALAPAAGQPAPAQAPVPAAPMVISPAMRAFAGRHDLSGMWQGLTEADTTSTLTPTVCDGFFGPDHYRIELVLLHVARDARDPLLYHVQGKDRYKRRVTPFAGTLRLRQLRTVAADKAALKLLEGRFEKFYTALGEFSWQETGPAGAGTFSGTLGIDFTQQQDSTLVSSYFQDHGTGQQFAHGARMYLTGSWASAQTGQRKKLLAAADIQSISEKVFPDFNVGERSFEVNPKYARLGWNTYWENDEWWADTIQTKSFL